MNLNDLVYRPAVEWRAAVDKLTPADIDKAQGEMVSYIEQLTRLRGYLEGRRRFGPGQRGHSASVRESNALIKKVRKALGFSYPDNPINF